MSILARKINENIKKSEAFRTTFAHKPFTVPRTIHVCGTVSITQKFFTLQNLIANKYSTEFMTRRTFYYIAIHVNFTISVRRLPYILFRPYLIFFRC